MMFMLYDVMDDDHRTATGHPERLRLTVLTRRD